ncbi:MAG: hypothetical protein GY796_01235 [Chloroflexi bacterium]|nr:hypothetical protein [Chloroflexota bacterium]
MKVASKLVKMDFVVGKIERKDTYLIIHSDPEKSTVPTKVRLDATDVWTMIRAGLNWPIIKYMLTLPFLYRQTQKKTAVKSRS